MRCPQREFLRWTFASFICPVFGFLFVSIVLIEPFFVGPCWPEPAEAAVFVRLQTLPASGYFALTRFCVLFQSAYGQERECHVVYGQLRELASPFLLGRSLSLLPHDAFAFSCASLASSSWTNLFVKYCISSSLAFVWYALKMDALRAIIAKQKQQINGDIQIVCIFCPLLSPLAPIIKFVISNGNWISLICLFTLDFPYSFRFRAGALFTSPACSQLG